MVPLKYEKLLSAGVCKMCLPSQCLGVFTHHQYMFWCTSLFFATISRGYPLISHLRDMEYIA